MDIRVSVLHSYNLSYNLWCNDPPARRDVRCPQKLKKGCHVITWSMIFEVMNFCLDSWMDTSSGISGTKTEKRAIQKNIAYCDKTKPHTRFSPLHSSLSEVKKICRNEGRGGGGKRIVIFFGYLLKKYEKISLNSGREMKHATRVFSNSIFLRNYTKVIISQ